jgi:hypothetical protein
MGPMLAVLLTILLRSAELAALDVLYRHEVSPVDAHLIGGGLLAGALALFAPLLARPILDLRETYPEHEGLWRGITVLVVALVVASALYFAPATSSSFH